MNRYNLIVARGFQLASLLAVTLWAFPAWADKQPKKPPPSQAEAAVEPEEPPEEDESLLEKEYVFNPLQAEKEVRVGRFYFKKGSWKAAALRFAEATRWDPGNAEAWLMLAESHEKLDQPEQAREALVKFLEAAPDHKKAKDVRKKLGRKS